METFQEMYFRGDVEFNGDALEVLEWRHDWANFRFTLSLFRFFLFSFVPEVIMHTRSQGKAISIFFDKFQADSPKMKSRSADTTIVETTSMLGSLGHG